MRNPLESEEVAFRFVLGTIVYLVPIVVAAWIAAWLGVIVFAVMSAVAFILLRHRATPVPATVSTARAAVEDTHRILVVTDAALVDPPLRDAIVRASEGATEDVLLICAVAASPAVAGGPEVSGTSVAEQLETALEGLRAVGINARGNPVVGDPLQAVEEALGRFDADEVLISGARASAASSERIAAAVRASFTGPVTVITDDGAG